jgi:hypothetical protein
MVIELASKTYTVYPTITEDGTIVWRTSKDNLVDLLPSGEIVGLSEFSKGIIERYKLNSDVEIQFRNLNTEIRGLAKSFESDREKVVGFFIQSLEMIQRLNRNSGKHSFGTDALLRNLLYAHIITALESLLSNFLICSITYDKKLLLNLGSKDESFGSQKYNLKDLIQSDKTALDLAVSKLHGIVFHNLNAVEKLYCATFGVEFPDCTGINNAIDNRHDIVHRSSRKKHSNHPVEYTENQIVLLIIENQKFIAKLLQKILAS